MSTAQAEIATAQAEIAKSNPAQRYRETVEKLTFDIVRGLVGDDRAKEAAGRFALAFRSVAMASPQIYDARPQSVALAVAMCALTGLMPGGPLPQCYVIPRKEKNPETNRWDIPGVQWMISWRGLKTLVERTGARLRAVPVWKGEEFDIVEGLKPDLRHVRDIDAEGGWEELRACYVVVSFPDGSHAWDAIGRKRIEARRAASDSYKRDPDSSPWTKWPIEMALKTAVRYCISRGIAPIDETGLDAIAKDDDEVPTERSVVATIVTQPQAAQARAIADQGGLADLEASMAAEARDLEPIRVDEPAPKVEAKTAEKAPPKPRAAPKPKETAPPKVELTQEHLELIATVKLGKDAVGPEDSVKAQKLAGIPPELRPEDMTLEQLQTFDSHLNEAANADQLGS